MTEATKVGRDLHIVPFGGMEPFIVHPLPGRAGVQITDTYLGVSGGENRAQEMTEAMIIAVDGAVYDPDADRWVPVPEEQQTNFRRIGMELSQAESESVIMPAFFWQTVLGIDGVRAYLEAGEGLAGTLKAAGALSRRLGLFVLPTSPRTASDGPTSAAGTPSTSTRPSGKRSARQPQDKRLKKPKG